MNDWWKEAVIYQIYPRSFLDTSGNGIGDLGGISKKLQYVADLGVDAIWLSPIFSSPMKDMGYDVSDYKSIDPLFGSMEDFDFLISTAHDKNLKVIIDQVLSHSSDQLEAFQESKKKIKALLNQIGMFGLTQMQTAHLRITGYLSLEVQHGNGNLCAVSIISITFFPLNQTSTSITKKFKISYWM
jgi:hypothetical protein